MTHNRHMNRLLLPLLAAALLCAACGNSNDYTPKPKAYLRIDMPQHQYALYDTAALPFTFERSTLADVTWKKDTRRDKWIDLTYPKYKGYVFLSYKHMQGPQDLRGQIDTSYELLKTHFNYSSGMDESQFVDATHKVYATTYRLKGQNVASTFQFWATDSCHNFLRGSFYIDCTPNTDSLSPILEFVQRDINHLLETLRWKE